MKNSLVPFLFVLIAIRIYCVASVDINTAVLPNTSLCLDPVAKISKYISLALTGFALSAYEDTHTALKHGKVALRSRIGTTSYGILDGASTKVLTSPFPATVVLMDKG